MDTPMNQPQTKPASDKFKDGLRAIFTTTKAQSDAQLEAFQSANERKREERKKK
jgi:hypothetical protein